MSSRRRDRECEKDQAQTSDGGRTGANPEADQPTPPGGSLRTYSLYLILKTYTKDEVRIFLLLAQGHTEHHITFILTAVPTNYHMLQKYSFAALCFAMEYLFMSIFHVTVKVKCLNCSPSDFPHRKNIVYRINGSRQTNRRGLDSKYIMPSDSYHQLPSAFKKLMTNINYVISIELFWRSVLSGYRGMSSLHQCVQNVASQKYVSP
ncbi:conserved hypothetical protein [Trichinella spiralis]|uniref:hypothetical protein n=1 Tax=Trichinella spiralis TaxID=6334 RepID=UPI0001EFB219|nr:conserved hypothetical protein [Trichinella spiralis]